MKRLLAIGMGVLSACMARPAYTDDAIHSALVAHEDTYLLYMAAAAVQGTDGMTFGFDTWWRLCEGRWTDDVRRYLPKITDSQLGAFLKRYGQSHRDVDPRSLMSPQARETALLPGESKTFTTPAAEWR